MFLVTGGGHGRDTACFWSERVTGGTQHVSESREEESREGHSMFLERGNIEKSSESRSLAGARLLNDVSTVRDHRLERFKGRKGTKRARRMCDVPEHRRVGVDTG